jgi:Zn-dependent M28 family amino/carboxypeptidase
VPLDAFSGDRAFAHLEKLAAIGPRVSGSRGADRARRYLERELRELGASVEAVAVVLLEPGASVQSPSKPREAVHLLGWLPGASSDRFLLAAAYDTRPVPDVEFLGANASASGSALLLELARAFSLRERPYTLVFALIDGDALPPSGPETAFAGSRALAAHLAQQGELARVRVAVFFQQVGDIELEIARDLRSHYVYRESFWQAAARLGRGTAFPSLAAVESVEGSHLAFIEQGLSRSVLISDPRAASRAADGDASDWFAVRADDAPEHCSPGSLQVVGEVTLAALDRIAARLGRIDRFHVSPLRDPSEHERSLDPMADPVIPSGPPGEAAVD